MSAFGWTILGENERARERGQRREDRSERDREGARATERERERQRGSERDRGGARETTTTAILRWDVLSYLLIPLCS